MKIKNIVFQAINPSFLSELKIAGDYECSIPYTFHAILAGKNKKETHVICHSLVYAQVQNKKVLELCDAKETGNGAEHWHFINLPKCPSDYEDSEEYTIECIEHSNEFYESYDKFAQDLKNELNTHFA